MRPGPQTKSTVGTCMTGTSRLTGPPDPPRPRDPPTAPAALPAEIDAVSSRPLEPDPATGYCSSSIAAKRLYTPETLAMACDTMLPSAIMSPESIAIVKVKDSPDSVCAASGFPAVPASWSCVQAWVIVSVLD